MFDGAMNGHIAESILILHRHLQVCRKTVLFLSEHMVAAGRGRISIILKQDLTLCYPN